MLTPSVTATLLDDNYVDYYYGVRTSEARPGRAAYVAESTLNTEISLRADYFIDERQAVFAAVQYTALGSEIKNSPLVDRSAEQSLLVGYLFRFQ